MNLNERLDQVLSPVLGHFTREEVVKGKGSYLYTRQGRRLLDFACGIAVTNTGHGHPQVIRAAKKQMSRLVHNCAAVTVTEANILYAEQLTSLLPLGLDHVWLCQSGSESVEAAVKCARYTSGKKRVIAFHGGFHGRTYGALSLSSSKPHLGQGFEPLVPGFEILPRDLAALKQQDLSDVAGFITELVLGEGGYVPVDHEFIQGLRQLADQHGIALIFDEIQTGFGRTGKLFAFEHYQVTPDILCLSKGIASGFPLGATVIKKEISEKWKRGTHGGTFTGNLVACAAASATLKVIQKEMNRMKTKIEWLQTAFQSFQKKYQKLIQSIHGLDYMIGVELQTPEISIQLQKKCLELGLLLIACGKDYEVIRVIPPVTASLAELKKGTQIFEQALQTL